MPPETRQVEKQQREAVEEFNQRLAQRDETLEKWKSAYEEAATVAHVTILKEEAAAEAEAAPAEPEVAKKGKTDAAAPAAADTKKK